MDTILLKYHSLGMDYLIYDICKNDVVLDQRAVQAICERNFGAGAAGILAGAVLADQELWLRFFQPDGSEKKISREERRVFVSYLKRAGYPGLTRIWVSDGRNRVLLTEDLTEADKTEEIGKIFLTDRYIRKNRLQRGQRMICRNLLYNRNEIYYNKTEKQ